MDLYIKDRNIEPELKKQVREMLPSVLADQLSVACLGIMNTIMAGHVSNVVLAGVGQVDAINMILVYVFSSFATAGTVTIAQNIGRDDKALAEKCVLQSLVAGTLFLSALAFILTLLRMQVLMLMYPGVEPAVRENSLRYILWSVPSLPLTFIFSQCAGALRSVGSVKIPMIGSIVMNVLNAILGFILIIGFMGFGGYGAYGAGIAIFVSRLIGVFLLIAAMLSRKAPIGLHIGGRFRFDFAVIKAILTIGVPIALETFLFQAGKLMVQVIVGTMGTVMISANQVYLSCSSIFNIHLSSFQIIMITLVAQRVGAKSREKSENALRYIANRCEVWDFFVALIAFCCAPLLCSMFTSEQEVIRAAALAVRISSPFILLQTPSFAIPMGFRGAGDVRYPLVISVTSVWIFRAFCSYLFGIRMGFLIYGVSFALGVDWVFRSFFYYRRMQKGDWLQKTAGPVS